MMATLPGQHRAQRGVGVFTVGARRAAWGPRRRSGWPQSREGWAAQGSVYPSWVPAPSLQGCRVCLSAGQGLPLAHGGHHAGRVGVAKGEAGGGVNGRRRGQDVSRVAEGREVTHRRHVSSQGGGAEG